MQPQDFFAKSPPARKSKAAPAPAPPAPPSWLSAEALALWREHSPVWHELGALGRLDVHACGMLCSELATYNGHAANVARDGALVHFPHYSGPNPEARLRDDAAKRILLLLRQCGLTRASRAGTPMQETKTATPASQMKKFGGVFFDE
jgi:P27 family predicted phage terminase small subunit